MLKSVVVRRAPSSWTLAVPPWTRAGTTGRSRRGAAQDAARRCAARALLLLVGLLLAPRSAAATEVSSELGLGQPVPIAAAGPQRAPAAACGADGCLALWEDTAFPGNVFGRRMVRGELIDPWPIEPTPRSGLQARPSLAAGGPGYLAVWIDDTESSRTLVMGARIDRNGVALDAEPLLIAEEDRLDSATVASDGATFLVVWNTANRRWARRVGADGAFLDDAPIDVAKTTPGGGPSAVAYDGTNYLVVWSGPRAGEGTHVHGARVTPAGVVLDAEAIAISPTDHDRPMVACRPGECLVAWIDSSASAPGVAAARVTSEGKVLGDAGALLLQGELRRWPLAVAAGGSGYLIVAGQPIDGSVEEHRVVALHVDGATGLADAGPTLLSTTPERDARVAAAFDGADYLVAWVDERSAPLRKNPDIHAARLSPGGALVEGDILLSAARNEQRSAAAAPSGDGFLAAWTEERTDGEQGMEIRAAWTDPDGVVLDAPAVLATAARDPAVAFGGAQHAVVYFAQGRDASPPIEGKLLDRTGEARSIDFSAWADTTPEDSRLASDGSGFVVASRFRWPSDSGGVQIGWIRANGKVTEPVVLDVEEEPSSPDIACDSGVCLVVWTGSDSGKLEARLVVGKTITRLPALSSFNAGPGTRPRVAHGGGRFAVVWGGPRAGSWVQAAVVAPDGELLAQVEIPTNGREAVVHEPSVAFDGERFVVAWIEHRRGEEGALEACDVFAARLSTTGEISAPFAVTDTPSVVEERLEVASNGVGRTLVAHDVYDMLRGDSGGRRVAARVLSDEVEGPDGGGGAGSGGHGGEGSGGDAAADDEGCGCRVAGGAEGESSGVAIAAVVLCLAAAVARARRGRSRTGRAQNSGEGALRPSARLHPD
ncbi:hypothetical protein [Sorangium sp. So ce854]|uniref:hypothetical protein n=1 Tax=Sorangium sp. So ce854 TaxID=3133322 RepID=UPI003F617F73